MTVRSMNIKTIIFQFLSRNVRIESQRVFLGSGFLGGWFGFWCRRLLMARPIRTWILVQPIVVSRQPKQGGLLPKVGPRLTSFLEFGSLFRRVLLVVTISCNAPPSAGPIRRVYDHNGYFA